MHKHLLLAILCLLTIHLIAAQEFTRQDSLRGTLSPQRTCYDVTFYDLHVRVNPEEKTFRGYNTIHFQVMEDFKTLQIDLFENLEITKITWGKQQLAFEREGNATFVTFPKKQKKGNNTAISVYYGGKPKIAVYPPWRGGLSWEKDTQGRNWIGISCQGLGASVWYPNKDHQSEEPDSMRIACEVPSDLFCVANGNLRSTQKLKDNYTLYEWFVSYPINNYCVSLNIAHYAHFSDTYTAEDGETLALDYYVLDYNVEKAQKHFKQVKPMLACFEKLFGKYPFWNDGFAMVETPYWGMEHQSAIAYGNNYKGNPFNADYDFDYIIIHESGHEYWGNSITTADIADMWVQEGFCTYTEALYIECMYSKADYQKYMNGLKMISNDRPILGKKGVNARGSDDMYRKGAWILHTLRSVLNNDEAWFKLIKGIAQNFERSITTSDAVIAFIQEQIQEDVSSFFEQYLEYRYPPKLEYKLQQKGKEYQLSYRWKTDVKNFQMKLRLEDTNNNLIAINPSQEWQEISVKNSINWSKCKEAYYIFLEEME